MTDLLNIANLDVRFDLYRALDDVSITVKHKMRSLGEILQSPIEPH